MISNLAFLGIYPDAIDNAIEKSEKLMQKLGFSENDIAKMHDEAKENLNGIGNFNDITNSIILAYFATVKSFALEDDYSKISYYINCSDSHLYYEGNEI